jgi:hypothetical protein
MKEEMSLSVGVQDWAGQHSRTVSQKQTNKQTNEVIIGHSSKLSINCLSQLGCFNVKKIQLKTPKWLIKYLIYAQYSLKH